MPGWAYLATLTCHTAGGDIVFPGKRFQTMHMRMLMVSGTGMTT